ncbi:MAG TPA: toll/interleukin-1 receptor domain-containing protein [Pyrinomonadaceae bacterium]|nr:toll/interleukin-1 receptor domain-containing protein [Pyrinomonadaceae bacterium]
MPDTPVSPFSGIFVSYRRDDSAGHAGRLFDKLVTRFGNDRIFMDIDTIEPGEDFVTVIENAVASCDILIAVIGREWVSGGSGVSGRLDDPNDFVRVEIAAALARDIRVIPVLVKRATMPKPEELPDNLAQLARRNAVELTDLHWQTDVEQLLSAMERVLAKRDEARLEEAAKRTEAEHQRKRDEATVRLENNQRLPVEEPAAVSAGEEPGVAAEPESARADLAQGTVAEGDALTEEVEHPPSSSTGPVFIEYARDGEPIYGYPIVRRKGRSLFIALGCLAVLGFIAVVWTTLRKPASSSNDFPSQSDASAKATPTPARPQSPRAEMVPSPKAENVPTPDKSKFEESLTSTINSHLDNTKGEFESQIMRNVVYGDLNGDGKDDAAVSFCVRPTAPAGPGHCTVLVFTDEKGTLKYLGEYLTPDNDEFRLTSAQEITNGKIICTTLALRRNQPSIKGLIKLVVSGTKIYISQN